MKKTAVLSLLLLLFLLRGSSQEIRYDAASISENLKQNAHVVKRYEHINFDVKDIDRAVCTIHRVYTVLDKYGESTLTFHEYTDQLRKIDDVDIRAYDAFGRQIARYKKKDLNKRAVLDGLAVDGMHHFLDINTASYPVTIEYKYEINFTGTLGYPSFDIQDADEGVEYSAFTAKVPSELDLRYLNQKTDIKAKVTDDGHYKSYSWEVKNLSAYKEEQGHVSGRFYYPSIILAPNKFRHYNTFGEMTSWKAFGKWAYDLSAGLDELPEERKQFFISLVKNAQSDREKAALIYDYLQKNFRYVSIQLGIGGVKPFPAKFTDEKKYGDCKGLSFYMHSVLKAVGVKSYCALINAEYNQEAVDPKFPCDRFNHEILCIPQQKDSIWLECTSNKTDFGVLGDFTENKNALLLTENGGVLVPTPASKAENNKFYSTTAVKLFDDGSGSIVTSINSTGAFRMMMSEIFAMKKDDQKSLMVRYLGFKQPDNFSVVKKSEARQLDLDISLNIEQIPPFLLLTIYALVLSTR